MSVQALQNSYPKRDVGVRIAVEGFPSAAGSPDRTVGIWVEMLVDLERPIVHRRYHSLIVLVGIVDWT